MKGVLFLDVDGVLNQYRHCERKKRYHRYLKSDTITNDGFDPYPKKVMRLAKLVKKYNLDVYVFSAWTDENLQPHLPFKLSGDTGKWAKNVHEIAKDYDYSLLIDDEIHSNRIIGKERMGLDDSIVSYQPNWWYGLVLKDFKKIDKILKDLKEQK